MLLWEGGKIKCEIATKGKKGGVEPIHVGGLAVVLIEDGEIVTAGADGHIRIWDLDVVDLADAPSEHDMVFTMDPQLERKVHPNRFLTKLLVHTLTIAEMLTGWEWS